VREDGGYSDVEVDRMWRGVLGAVGVAALLTLPAPAFGSGPPAMAVQHESTNGVFGSAEWQTQSQTRSSDVLVNVIRQRHGPPILDLAAVYDQLDRDGSVVDETFIVTDTSTGFQFSSDPTGLASADLAGRVPATICTHLFTTCRPGNVSLAVTWTGGGPITRGATTWRPDVEPGFGSLYLFDEHTSGSSRAAAATGTLNGHTLTAPTLVSATIGTERDGSVFVCLNDGCEN
jgi:hypothetical protein